MGRLELVIRFPTLLFLLNLPSGKTSLCKALAHKLAIRLSNKYSCGQLIEVNAHSLFSKWFSESGKLVMKLFQKIDDLVQDESVFVCVLIGDFYFCLEKISRKKKTFFFYLADEVESLTAARKSAVSGSEPSDAIRVVNALLTQLDQLKQVSVVRGGKDLNGCAVSECAGPDDI